LDISLIQGNLRQSSARASVKDCSEDRSIQAWQSWRRPPQRTAEPIYAGGIEIRRGSAVCRKRSCWAVTDRNARCGDKI